MAFLEKRNDRRNLYQIEEISIWLSNPGVSSMIVCVPQEFKWVSTQPFEGIVSSFFNRRQDLLIAKKFLEARY